MGKRMVHLLDLGYFQTELPSFLVFSYVSYVMSFKACIAAEKASVSRRGVWECWEMLEHGLHRLQRGGLTCCFIYLYLSMIW
jgi:hypothetical protein